MIRRMFVMFAVVVLAGQELPWAQRARSPEAELKAAQQKSEIEGDYRAAIVIYENVAKGTNRALAAQALLRMADAHQKLGEAEAALRVRQRLIREYPEQKQAAEASRSLAQGNPTRPLTTRLVWGGPGVNAEGGVSFDGRFLCFSDEDGDVAIRDLSRGTNRKLTRMASLRTLERGNPLRRFMDYCVVSRDGRQVAYSVTDGGDFAELRVIGTDGSRDRRLYQSGEIQNIQPYDWNADGTQIVLVAQRETDEVVEIWIVDLAGSVKVVKSPVQSLETVRFSPISPLLAYDAAADDSGTHDVFLLKADGSGEAPVSRTVTNEWVLGWAPDGRSLLFGSDRTSPSVWSIDIVDGQPRGEPRLVRRDTGYLRSMGSTRSGTLYHVVLAPPTTDAYIATIDPKARRIVSPPQRVSDRFSGRTNVGDWSADGTAAAYIKRDVGPRLGFAFLMQGGGTIVLPPRPGSTEEREVSVAANVVSFRWSPDGNRMVARLAQGQFWATMRESGEVERLPLRDVSQPSWMPDNDTLLYIKEGRLFAYGLSARRERLVFDVSAPETITTVEASPDGQWIAVRIRAADNTATIRVVSPDGRQTADLARQWRGGNLLAWARDSRSVLMNGPDDNGRPAIFRATLDGPPPRFVASFDMMEYLGRSGIAAARLSRDGEKLLFELRGITGPPDEIWALENVFPGGSVRR